MAKLKPVSSLLATYFFALITSFFVGLFMLYNIIRKGPGKYFKKSKYETRPECMDDPVYGNHGYVTTKSGVKLHTVTAGEPEKPVMIFLHGFPECWYSWRYQIKEFSKDHRTFAVDMRGYGESDKPAGVSNYALDILVEDMKDLVEAIGAEKCILVAHDWGGIVAQIFTLKYPSLVEKLILCNIPHLRAFIKHLQNARSQQKKSWYLYFFQLPWIPEILFEADDYKVIEVMFSREAPITKRKALETQEEKNAFKFALSSKGGLSCPFNYYRALFRYAEPNLNTWIISVPTLFVFGIHDGAIDREACELSRQYFLELKIRYVDEARHCVQQEAPQQVNKAVRAFLDKNESEC